MKVVLIALILLNTAYAEFLPELAKIIASDPNYVRNQNNKVFLEYSKTEAETNLYLPSLDFSHTHANTQTYFSDDESMTNLSRLSLNYTLFNFGTDWKSYKASDYALKSFYEEFKEELMSREESLVQLLLQKVLFQENIKNQEAILKLKEKSYEIAQQRFKRGTFSQVQLAKVKIDFYNSKSNLLNQRERLNSTLASLSGYKIPQNMVNDFPFTQFFKKNGLKKVLTLPIGQETPTLKKLNFSMEAEEAQLIGRRNSYLGEISIQYNRDKYFNNDNEGTDAWSSAIVYTLPLFENYSREKSYKTAKTRLMVAKRYYDFEKNQLLKRQEFARDNLKLAYTNFQDRLEILEESNNLYDSILERFKKGLISVNELVIEQDRLLQTKTFTNRGIYNLHLKYIEYLHQLGLPITENTQLFAL